MNKKLKIAFVSSEVAPFSKTGGLADVSGALPQAIKKLGHEVKIFTPQYKSISENVPNLENVFKNLEIPILNYMRPCELNKSLLGNTEIFFIKNNDLFFREGLYGSKDGDYLDNAERFIFFNKAVIESLIKMNFQPDIIHINDWQTGLIPAYIKVLKMYEDFFANTKFVFTIHNIGYQGLFWHFDMPLTGLPWEIFNINGIEYYGKISFLKAGIVYSDLVTTVSKKYAQEIQTPEYGHGFEGILQSVSHKLIGILNGVDYSEWNPETDPIIAKNYSIKKLSGKNTCKKDLLKYFKLKYEKDIPVIGMITRLTVQKGIDILMPILEDILNNNDVYFTILGSGDVKYENFFKEIKEKIPEKVGLYIGYNNELAHKIEAGADMFLMPSLYEPCGLNQMYSLKYGTVPIVRATGGLDDTIENITIDNNNVTGTGFKFQNYSSDELYSTIIKALDTYKNKKIWEQIIKNGMQKDYSWNTSAKEYVKNYLKLFQ